MAMIIDQVNNICSHQTFILKKITFTGMAIKSSCVFLLSDNFLSFSFKEILKYSLVLLSLLACAGEMYPFLPFQLQR